jgi:uncharacterized protein
MTTTQPVREADRIESLDVLRGVALLGILLLNVLGFGLASSGYFDPTAAAGAHPTLNLAVWATVDVLFEGAMRCLFSMLFGAGVVLFTQGAGTSPGKPGTVHYRRQFWLLVFGLVDALVFLWTGDILTVYALAGALLYLCRNASGGRLLAAGVAFVVLLSAVNAVQGYGMGLAQAEAAALGRGDVGADAELAAAWHDFEADYTGGAGEDEELAARRDSYVSAFRWTASVAPDYFLFVVPVVLFWDALAMMLIGMGLYRLGVLDASRSTRFYTWLGASGFALGLACNLWEVNRAFATDFDPLATFPYFQPTYHAGRLGMALGWLALTMLVCRAALFPGIRARLAAVGRMALTNYLMHSLLGLLVFTGAGFALVGTLERWALYVFVVAVWCLQLALSPWWLARYRFGPAEWLWRKLTYGRQPKLRR